MAEKHRFMKFFTVNIISNENHVWIISEFCFSTTNYIAQSQSCATFSFKRWLDLRSFSILHGSCHKCWNWRQILRVSPNCESLFSFNFQLILGHLQAIKCLKSKEIKLQSTLWEWFLLPLNLVLFFWDYATFISSWQPFSRISIRFFLVKSQKISKSQFFLPLKKTPPKSMLR